MTLAESKMQKTMVLTGLLHRSVNIIDLFMKVYAVGIVEILNEGENYAFRYEGNVDEGGYVISQIMEASRAVKQNVRLEIKCHYRPARPR